MNIKEEKRKNIDEEKISDERLTIYRILDLYIEAVLDRLPTAEIIEETDKGYKVKAEIYGEGVKRCILSQKEFLKVTKPREYIDEIKNTIQRMYDLFH